MPLQPPNTTVKGEGTAIRGSAALAACAAALNCIAADAWRALCRRMATYILDESVVMQVLMSGSISSLLNSNLLLMRSRLAVATLHAIS